MNKINIKLIIRLSLIFLAFCPHAYFEEVKAPKTKSRVIEEVIVTASKREESISLVNAGVLSFKNSVGIVFGANIGTTITAQLVAFKLTAFAPIIIILGFLLSLLRSRASVFGKAVFYFGFVFFALNLISSSLQPLQNNDWLVELLSRPQNPTHIIAWLFVYCPCSVQFRYHRLGYNFYPAGYFRVGECCPTDHGGQYWNDRHRYDCHVQYGCGGQENST